MKVVTVGTGMAAVEFVQSLRRDGFDGEIVMCSDEPFAPYSPCVIPFFLAGEPLESVYWKGEDFYQRHGVRAHLGDAVLEVDPDAMVLRCASGHRESFDRLFFASGSRSWYPQPRWLETEGVFGFKTLSDMLAIDRFIREEGIERVVIFGGGFIGVDAALALHHRGLQVTLVHRNTRLLSQMTDEEGGRFATERLVRRTGMEVRLKTLVSGVESRDGKLTAVELSSGERLETGLMLMAIGVSPNSEPLCGHDRGVPSSPGMLAAPGIYTAGDVALTRHAVSGEEGLFATYPNAMGQARAAARHLLHGDGCFVGSVNSNVLKKHIDFPVISAGRFAGEAVTWQKGDLWRRVYLQDGAINGYILIGDTRISGYIHQLYLSRARVDDRIRGIISDSCHAGYYRDLLNIPPRG